MHRATPSRHPRRRRSPWALLRAWTAWLSFIVLLISSPALARSADHCDTDSHHSNGAPCSDPGPDGAPCDDNCPCACCGARVLAAALAPASWTLALVPFIEFDFLPPEALSPVEIHTRVFHPPEPAAVTI